jgi:glyoxylate reductase
LAITTSIPLLLSAAMSRSALLIGPLVHIRPEWSACSSFIKLHEYATGSRSDFLSKLKSNAYPDLFVIYRSNESAKVTGPFDKEVVDALPASLKFICHNGAGYDNIDVQACTERGIQVASTPVAVNNATADVAIFLMLGALRRIAPSIFSVKQGMHNTFPCH